MDKGILIHGAGIFLFVGFLLIFFDNLIKKLSEAGFSKMSDEDLAALSKEERSRYEFRLRNNTSIQAHAFRKGGFLIVGIGVVLWVTASLLPDGYSLPAANNFLVNIVDLLFKSRPLPWGPFSLGFGFIWIAIGLFCLAAGREHWKLRHAHPRAVLCFLLGLALIIEGIFQWGI